MPSRNKFATLVCANCKKEFHPYYGNKQVTFCSLRCRVDGTLLDRFWKKVDKRADCWVWEATKVSGGYGHFKVSTNSLLMAHRFSWSLENGPIPKGMDVLHRCDNPPCVRPEHLFIGNDRDNAADREMKGRGRHSKSRPGIALAAGGK